MDTQLTVEQICLALRNSGLWNKRSDIMIPNLSWGLLPYEADFIVVSKAGYMTEVEIKRSWEDFKADFKKDHRHDDERIYYFAYCVPLSISDKVVDYLKEQRKDERYFMLPAVLTYTEDMEISISELKHFDNYNAQKRRKLFLEEQLTIARLGQLRYWSKVEKDYEEEQS